MSRAPRRRAPRREWFACPHCGADVAIGAKVCRECGSDAATGWLDGEEIDYASVELPDEDGAPARPQRHRGLYVLVALLVAFALLATALWR